MIKSFSVFRLPSKRARSQRIRCELSPSRKRLSYPAGPVLYKEVRRGGFSNDSAMLKKDRANPLRLVREALGWEGRREESQRWGSKAKRRAARRGLTTGP